METYIFDVGDVFLRDMRKRSKSPGEVVMVIRRPGGKVLLSTKEFYPPGVFRLPTGKMNPGEDPESALIREVHEETGFRARGARLLDVIRCTARNQAEAVDFNSYIYILGEIDGEPKSLDPDEQITEFREVEPCELKQIATQLRELPDDWRDWGQFRAIAHEFVYKKLCPHYKNCCSNV